MGEREGGKAKKVNRSGIHKVARKVCPHNAQPRSEGARPTCSTPLLVTSNYALMPSVNVLIIYTRRDRGLKDSQRERERERERVSGKSLRNERPSCTRETQETPTGVICLLNFTGYSFHA